MACLLHSPSSQWILAGPAIIGYMVLPQGEHKFVLAIRVGCVVVWPIFSTSKMKAFCIYFYQGNITFKNIINLVSFILNLVEYGCNKLIFCNSFR